MLPIKDRPSKARPALGIRGTRNWNAESLNPAPALSPSSHTVSVSILISLAESRTVIVLVGVLRAIGALVAVVGAAIVAVSHRIVSIAITSVIDALFPAVAVASRERWLLIAARPPIPSIVAVLHVDANAIEPLAITGTEPSTEFVAIPVAAAVAVVPPAIAVAIDPASLDGVGVAIPRILRTLLHTLAIAAIVRAVASALSPRRRRHRDAGGQRNEQ